MFGSGIVSRTLCWIRQSFVSELNLKIKQVQYGSLCVVLAMRCQRNSELVGELTR